MFKNVVITSRLLRRLFLSAMALMAFAGHSSAYAQTLGAVKVMAGEASTCVQTSAGGLKCWGRNGAIGAALTQLGTVNRAPSVLLPSDVVGATSGVASASFDGNNQCVITVAGVVQCRSPLTSGPADGFNKTENFTAIPVLNGAKEISVGFAHLCALTANNGMKCWGSNRQAQIAGGAPDINANVFVPSDVSSLTSGVAAVSADVSHSCAVTSAGAVKCWGNTEAGQAGARDRFSFLHANPDVMVGMETGMVSVDTGNETTCAVTNAGALKCAGRFSASLPSGVASVSIGQAHGCVVTTTGGVKCWGFNSKGQLGNGAVLVGINNTPVDVVGLGSGSGVVSVAAEGVHTCAVLATGAVKCWGDNSSGQLGNGTTISSALPLDAGTVPPVVVAPIATLDHQPSVGSGLYLAATLFPYQLPFKFVAGDAARSPVVGAQLTLTTAPLNAVTCTTPTLTDSQGLTQFECVAGATPVSNVSVTLRAASNITSTIQLAVGQAAPPPPASNPPVTPQTISNLAGTAGTTGGGVVNGVPLTGRTFNTGNVITDRDGNIFFTNADGLIYCISSRSGLLFTIGGIGSATLGINGFGGDGGPATLASFNNPTGLVFDAAGNLYIADTGNNRVRRINLVTGIVTTIAGGGASTADNIQGTTALLTAPRSLAFGPDGLLYIAEGANRIRRLNVATGVLSFFAGTGVAGYGGDNGAALSAVFSDIYYITFDFQGNLFIVDRGNNRIRCINRAGIVLPVAGTGAIGFGGDGGLATSALFRDIRYIAFDYFGQLYISDAGNNRIRRLNLLTGLISTFSVNNATFNPYGLYFDAMGSLYTAELGLLRAVRFIDNPGFAINFPTRARIAAGTTALSDVRSFTGFTGTVSLSIEGGEYNIGCSAANPFISGITSLTISNPPQTVCLRVTAGTAAGDARTAKFRVNNTASPFTVLTLDPDLLPRYRIYVPSLKRHLYTTDTNEYNVLTGISATYSGEGINHYLYRAPVNRAAQTAIPYYRLYFKPQQRHFYTSDFNEYNAIRANTAFASDEGTTGYIFPKYGVPGTTALYRLYNSAINSHLWTTDSNEFNFLRNNGWTAEGQPGNASGVDGYVFP